MVQIVWHISRAAPSWAGEFLSALHRNKIATLNGEHYDFASAYADKGDFPHGSK
jgi:hypothetical protein